MVQEGESQPAAEAEVQPTPEASTEPETVVAVTGDLEVTTEGPAAPADEWELGEEEAVELGPCAICRQPIEAGQRHVVAAYGPVHAEPCSHMSKPV